MAGALERKVWVKTRIGPLYPGFYIILVGPPGVGKTVLTSLAKSMWLGLDRQHIASDSVSRASLLDDLRDASRNFISRDMTPVNFNSMKVGIDELGVLIPTYESDFISILTAIWDGKSFSERKRTKELNYRIENPQLHIFGGCTPSFLNDLLPEGAWDQGFTARCIFVYSGQVITSELFGNEAEESLDSKRFNDLIHDLKIIGELYGRMTFEPKVVDAITSWHMKGGEPRPDHPKLQSYIIRRSNHLIRLCQVASVARSSDLIVTLQDYRQALDWLLDVEAYMPDIFKSMSMGGDNRVIEDTYHVCYKFYMKHQAPIKEQMLISYLAERVPAEKVGRIIQVMVSMGILTEKYEQYGKAYEPKAKRSFN